MSEKHIGRVPNAIMEQGYEKYVRVELTMPPSLRKRLDKYCKREERTMSWCVQKSLDEWLKERGC